MYLSNMTLKEAVEILEKHNKWRRDNNNQYEMANPKELGIAIDTVVQFIKEDLKDINT